MALHITSPSGALAVVIFGNNEAGAATARDEEHSDRSCRDLFRLATGNQFNLLLLWPWRSFSSYLPVRLSSSGAATWACAPQTRRRQYTQFTTPSLAGAWESTV